MITWKGETIYRIREVAAILGQSRQAVYAAIAAGKLQARAVGGVKYVADGELDRYLGQTVEVRAVTTTAAQRREAAAALKRLEAAGW